MTSFSLLVHRWLKATSKSPPLVRWRNGRLRLLVLKNKTQRLLFSVPCWDCHILSFANSLTHLFKYQNIWGSPHPYSVSPAGSHAWARWWSQHQSTLTCCLSLNNTRKEKVKENRKKKGATLCVRAFTGYHSTCLLPMSTHMIQGWTECLGRASVQAEETQHLGESAKSLSSWSITSRGRKNEVDLPIRLFWLILKYIHAIRWKRLHFY